jgi:four helix bundle protein
MYKSFKEMPVWQAAMSIAEEIFRITESLPKIKDYGLTSQLRRSELSISANIAETFGKQHSKVKINFYSFARGSLTKAQSHLEFAKRVGYLSEESQRKLDKQMELLQKNLNKIKVILKSQS